MTPQERFRQAKELFYQALEIERESRPHFIQQACGDDTELLNEVNALLAEEQESVFTEAIRQGLAHQAVSLLSNSHQETLIGQVLDHRYTITEYFSEGGMSVLYLASDKDQPLEPVLIKILKEQPSPEVQNWLVKHFTNQAKALARLKHPGIINNKGFGFTTNGQPFLVMDRIVGTNLRTQIIVGKGLLGGWPRIANILRQLGAAISAAHDSGIYHRDLKPENIMLQATGNSTELEQLKVIDFDIATVKDSYDEKTQTTLFIAGSFDYAAPEQFEQKPGRASDIYALSMIAYEMLTGKLPFPPINKTTSNQFQMLKEQLSMRQQGKLILPRELNPRLPQAVEDLLLQALAAEPSLRPKRADRFMNKLADALLASQALPVVMIPVDTITTNPVASGQLKKLYLPISLVLLVSLLGGVFIGRYQHNRIGNSNSLSNPATQLGLLTYQLKYSLSLREVQANSHYSEPVSLAGQEIIFHSGDLIKLNILSTTDGYLYIVSERPAKGYDKPKFTLLFPDAQESNLLRADRQTTIPAGNDPGFQFIGAKGTEKIWLIYARKPQLELDSLRRLINSTDMGIVNAPQQVEKLQSLLNEKSVVRPVHDEEQNMMIAQGAGEITSVLLKLIHN